MIAQDFKTSEALADHFWFDEVLPQILSVFDDVDRKIIAPDEWANRFMTQLLTGERSPEERQAIIFAMALECLGSKISDTMKAAGFDRLVSLLSVSE
jgi:hypothetical protein